MSLLSFDIVVPTVARPSLWTLLHALAGGEGPRPGRIVVVDDRPASSWAPLDVARDLDLPVHVCRSFGAGPAAARNTGWKKCAAEWIVFLDDDVIPSRDWYTRLADDLTSVHPDVAGSQGNVDVPLAGSRPTDWQRNVAQLESSEWITADMAYRTYALRCTGGFDERFPRAFREDTDLALQVLARGYQIVRGGRRVTHPVGRASSWVSVTKQAGNADDALMRRRYGRSWRRHARAPQGRLPLHIASVAFGASALVAFVAGKRRFAVATATGWVALATELVWTRVRSGPRTASEITAMVGTSLVLPPVAVWHRVKGELAVWRAARRGFGPHARADHRSQPDAVLFDRDGTLVHDVPYNGDPDAVEVVEGATRALARLRAAGMRVAVVTNQSGVARGLLTPAQVSAVNRRVGEKAGHIDHFQVCPHDAADRCSCRKPAPGLIHRAAARLGVTPYQCVVIGDTEADVAAGRAAGARAILVPNGTTLKAEVARAPEVAPNLEVAVDWLVGA